MDAFRNDSRRKILKVHGRKEKWGPHDFEEFLKRIATGLTPAEVERQDDMPGKAVFFRYLQANPAFKKKYQKIWDSLPHSVHVRASKLGTKFQKDVIKLRRQDMDWPEIAEELGVNEHAARTTWHKLKKQGKLKPADAKHEYKRYTRKDYDEYLRRILPAG